MFYFMLGGKTFLWAGCERRITERLIWKGIGGIPLANSFATSIVTMFFIIANTKRLQETKILASEWTVSAQLLEIMKYFNNKVIFHHLPLWDVISFAIFLAGSHWSFKPYAFLRTQCFTAFLFAALTTHASAHLC